MRDWTAIGANLDDSWPLSPIVGVMHETYRMLGKEHEADLEREAAKVQRATQVPNHRRTTASLPTDDQPRTAGQFARGRIVAFLTRAARSAS